MGGRGMEHELQRKQHGSMGRNGHSDNANDAMPGAGHNGHGRGRSLLKQNERNEHWKFIY